MERFDFIIAGAGPSGGQCAKTLALAGRKVLLVEKAASFADNNYSSGGAPLEVMSDYSLPDSTVGSYWNNLAIYTANDSHTWSSPSPKGVVLDFHKLRSSLANDVSGNGGAVWMGHAYAGHDTILGELHVHIRDQASRKITTVRTSKLIDATGCERQVIAGKHGHTTKMLSATGVEYLLEVEPATYTKYSKTLSFFLGDQWMPEGYAWIFPMDNNKLKVGIIRYFSKERNQAHPQPYKQYLDNLIKERIGPHTLLGKHGKTLTYSWGQHDCLGYDNVIGVGDAISMLNPLACEGIRHALFSGRVAAESLLGEHQISDYGKKIKRHCIPQWLLCEWLVKRFYQNTEDKRVDLFLRNLKQLSFDELLDLAFNYKIGLGARFLFKYSLHSMLHQWNLIA